LHTWIARIEPIHKKSVLPKIQIEANPSELGHHPMLDVGYFPPNTPPPIE
jgi:hypothetical protein